MSTSVLKHKFHSSTFASQCFCVPVKPDYNVTPPPHDYSYQALCPTSLQKYTLHSTIVMLDLRAHTHTHTPTHRRIHYSCARRWRTTPENIRYWFLHLHKAKGLLLRKLGEWKMKNSACLGGVMLLLCFFFSPFVCISQASDGEGGKWKWREIKLASTGEYGED